MRSFLWLAVACLVPLALRADEPPKRYQVVTPKPDGIIATGINARGDVIGFEWVEDPVNLGVIGEEPFFARGKTLIRLPLLPTYTSTFPAAVSDGGLVVGRASKPGTTGRRVPMQHQGFVWTEADGIQGLGALPGEFASFATGVSRDGIWVSGLSVGENRMTPCVWERTLEEGRTVWRVNPLPQLGQYCSNVVAISGDGRLVAGVDGSLPTLWTRAGLSKWTRETVGTAGAITPRAVNNAGTIAGIIAPRDGSIHAVVWSRAGGVQPIAEPEGYVRSEALAINNAGTIVGMIGGPAGSALAPRGFVWEIGKLRILEEGGPDFASATAINDAGQISGVFEHEEDEPAQPARPADPKP